MATANTRPTTPVHQGRIESYGKYYLIRQLAEGGMAQIYLAKQVGPEGFERNVVIKRMLPHLSQAPDFVGMFLDEARLAAQLAHQNIVQISELGFADGCYYICMEYLAGEDFSTILRTASTRRQYVPLNVAVAIIAEAAQGLHFAHEFTDGQGRCLNIVHRDISPSNILVTYQGGVKVLDFGIAKAESRITQTTAGIVKGKYMYMAAEQAKGLELDRRADVYSLGVSLYEALTNTRAFARDNDLAVLNAVLRGDFKPLRTLRPEIPGELEAIVLKAMSHEREDRYQTAAAMAHDLERFLDAGTSASGGKQIATYVQALFGDERVAQRSRIPTLSALVPNIALTKEKSSANLPALPDLVVEQPSDAGSFGPGNTKVSASRPKRARGKGGDSGRNPLRSVSMGVLGGIFVAFGGLYGWQRLHPAPPPEPVASVSPAPAPVSPPAPVAPVVPSPAQHTALVPPSAAAGPVPVAPPVASLAQPAAPPPAPVVRTAPRPARVKQLSIEDIQRVVSRGRAQVTECLELHQKDLPNDAGEVSVKFSILGSGRVAHAETQGALAKTAAARCLEARLARLPFPAHGDKEVQLSLPFAYRVRRE
ncbi:MAG: protein kinase domain-containing protein [Myxococcaceae bacterium]